MTPPRLGHRIALGMLTLAHIAFAALQFNDPDPITWIAIYGVTAALCAVAAFRRIHWAIPLVLALAATVAAFLLWPEEYQGITGKMDSRPGVELARESLGLGICALTLLYIAAIGRSASRH